MREGLLYVVFLVLLTGAPSIAVAQHWNPFDIKNRSAHWVDSLNNLHLVPQEEETSINLAPAIDSTIALAVSDSGLLAELPVQVSEQDENKNPFEVTRIPRSNQSFEDPLLENVADRMDKDLLFTLLLILLICLAILVGLYRTFIVKLYKSMWNENYLKLLYRSINEPIRFRFGAFYLFYFLNAGLFVYLSLGLIGKDSYQEGPVLLMACVLVIFMVYVLKHLVLYFLGVIFPVSKESYQFNFSILLYNCLLGILLVPINAVMAFAVEEIVLTAAYIGLGLSLLFYILRQFKGLILGVKFLSKNFFHFFIYLCAVEIGPVFILWKMFQSV